MNPFLDYLVSNIPLFCISFVVLFLAIRNFNIRRTESIYFIIFTVVVFYLSAVVSLEKTQAQMGHVEAVTFFTASGYITRPVLIYLFCMIANMGKKHRKIFYIGWAIPLFVNFIIYLFPLFFGFEPLAKAVFYYRLLPNGTAEFVRGDALGSALNFSSHFFSIFYIVLLVVISTLRFHGKHRRDGLILLFCAFFIVITVLAEVLAERNDLLNIISEICVLVNYIFITLISNSIDLLTELYNRKTFYLDTNRYRNLINGVIQIDMNGLKHLNDEYGHTEGDKALQTVGDVLDKSLYKPTMFAYRMSGDEFVILMMQGKKEQLDETTIKIKELMKETKYSVAVGAYFIDKDDKTSFDDAMKKAEALMYKDKDKFYASSNIKRR